MLRQYQAPITIYGHAPDRIYTFTQPGMRGQGNTAVRPGADNYQTVHADSIPAMLAQKLCSHYQEFTEDSKAGDLGYFASSSSQNTKVYLIG